MATFTLDMSKLDAIVAKEMPKHEAAIVAKGQEKTSQFAGVGLSAPITIEGGIATFCAIWPGARDTALMMINAFGWLMPSGAAKLKAAIAAINQYIYPLACPKP